VDEIQREGSMSKKSKSTQSQNFQSTNQYGFMNTPDTDDFKRMREFDFQADPSIANVYGNARNQAANSFNNPLGGVYSPQMRDQILRSTLSDLSQKEGQARSEAYNDLQGARFSQRAAVAGLTAPRLVQQSSSGTSSGVGTTSSPIWTDLLIAAAGGASSGTAA